MVWNLGMGTDEFPVRWRTKCAKDLCWSRGGAKCINLWGPAGGGRKVVRADSRFRAFGFAKQGAWGDGQPPTDTRD